MNEISKEKPKELKIMVLDNGAFYKAKKLVIPENIVLVFPPSYSPELNPAEKIWGKFKRAFTNNFYSNLEDVEKFISEIVIEITKKEVRSICGFSYVFSDDIWTELFLCFV